jgi:hypothetical protein
VANGQAYALGEGEECIECEVERGEELERYSLWKTLRYNSLTEENNKHWMDWVVVSGSFVSKIDASKALR